MSGDVQPRKRKDKKKKKDELGLDEGPRGTAAPLGEGDVLLHAHSDHGTGGHWCAKLIFFSLLAVLITLIGLIILENRGLSELEASTVHTQYSGVLEGWLEDAPDDDHHDEHTLELKHPDDDHDDHEEHNGHDDDDDDHDEVEEDDDDHDHEDSEELTDEENNDEDDHEDLSQEELDNEEQEEDNASDDDEPQADEENDDNEIDATQEEQGSDENTAEDDENDLLDNNEDVNEVEENNAEDLSDEKDDGIEQFDNEDEQNESQENEFENKDEDDHDDEHASDEEEEVEIEKIEQEAADDEEPISNELPALPEADDDDDDDDKKPDGGAESEDDQSADEADDGDFLQQDDDDDVPPVVEPISAPKGKPFQEVDEADSSEVPVDTLAEEEEYERQQEELRRQQEEASHKDGGNSVDDEGWPGEPSDAYWGRQLNSAEREMHQGHWNAAIEMASAKELSSSARARWIIAKAYDAMAESRRDNQLLSKAIAAYMELLKMNAKLSDKKLLEITNRTLDRIQFRGIYLNAEPVHRLLIRRFPNNPGYRNNLTISFLMANRADLAEEVLKETLKLWPEDRVALAHYAFVLKTLLNRVEEAEKLFRKALEGDSGAANEPRFYYHWGDALLLLGRNNEAEQVHKQAAKLGHFLSPAQRSLYNVNRLKSRPWWNINETPYARLAQALEKSWKQILKEGEAARALYVEEKEGLREKGDWSQLDLFVRGREIQDRCKRAPITCSIVKSEAAAIGCRRGQIKFSSMEPGTHVRPHVGPTNCRLRMHLALSNTENTFMRVHKETRQFQLGKTWLFDDSFEHEVWHNGSATRLVLIVDLWHPDLTAAERRTLPAI